jgi:hypothetical protein
VRIKAFFEELMLDVGGDPSLISLNTASMPTCPQEKQ